MKLFRVLILGIILTLHSLSSLAVLRGYDINETVIMLNSELETFVGYVNTTIIDFSKSRDNYKKKMHEIRKELASAKLSLYSQQDQYIFGNAYASEYAQKFCEKFHQSELPIKSWSITYKRAISRCGELQKTLAQINPDDLNDKAKISQQNGLKHLDCVLSSLNSWQDTIHADIKKYDLLVADVAHLEGEIERNYKYILNSLLLQPDKQAVPKVFNSDFSTHWDACKSTIKAMFTSSNYYGWEFQDKWTSETIDITISGLVAFVIGILLGFIILKRLPEKWEQMHRHPIIFYASCGCILVAITYFIMMVAFTTNPFFNSALGLLIEICLMCIFLSFSVLLRVRDSQFIPTLLSYIPTVILSLAIILYRISLSNIHVIRVTYPILLFLIIIAQIGSILFLHKKMLKIDRFVSICATAIFILCFSMNFFGYYYLSIHIALAWSMYITGHLLLSCYYNYLERCERYWRQINEQDYLKSWRPFTFNQLLKPIALIGVFMACTLECAHVFNINEWLNEFYNYNFVDYPGIACISIKRIFHIVIFAILINYLVALVNYILRRHYKEKADVGAMNLARSIFAIVVWSVFIVVALAYVEVNSIGIIATLGGLAVGLGIALRDTFDCLLCGIILMMGRIKIGDVVEVGNDIRGKVVDIQYRTTLIETDDGAIISVFNTQFFGKDFRNVSYSGKYQRLHISFKVQKEIDSPQIREMLAQALIDKVPELAKSPAPRILFGASDRFHVDMIAQVWVPVMDYYETISNVKETLFNTLKEHGMSNMSVDSRVRLIKNIVEPDTNNNSKK